MNVTTLHNDTDRNDTDGTAAARERWTPPRAAIGAVGVVLVAALGITSWLALDARSERDALLSDAQGREQAEQVALDYAIGAAEMDFRDLEAWKDRLVAGTAPALTDRLTKAATSMEQIIVPLQWSSTAEPITAKAEAGPDGTYTVDCFVSVHTTNAQAPEGIQSTATYRLTLDGDDEWVITEISGIGGDSLPNAPR
ncbi:hypothetical protein ACWDTG_20300 [Rhodococcus zopfii]|uniref:hypothetical protein n=1 Tax=Rhodococcus zopfii TaxID=43772 RepID=UPI0011114E64|nr:hypothetical protein [Rhodococcus zopfii]